jgi:hypothetical protein
MITMRSMAVGTGGELLARIFESLGVRLVLSIPGSQVLPVLDATPIRSGRMTLVVPRSERSSAFMAEGFGKASGMPAVVLSTLGPGTANELPGIHSAALSRAPVLSVTPFQPPQKRGRMAEVFQGLDQPTFFSKPCKRCFLVESRRDMRPALAAAFEECTGRPQGPVHVDVSFPILFSYGRLAVPARRRPGTGTRGTRSIVVSGERPAARAARRGAAVLRPGEPGGIVPFSLGVLLAEPESRVITETGIDTLEQSLGTLAAARALGLVPRIAASGRASRARAVAGAFGFPLENAKSKVEPRPGWTIVVTGS